jgi:hypothetical protein
VTRGEAGSCRVLILDVPLPVSHLSPTGGPGYSALIFDNQTEVTRSGIEKALEYAQAGLPVVFVGELPATSPYYSEKEEDIQAIVNKMLQVSDHSCMALQTVC